jgi:tryptophanase
VLAAGIGHGVMREKVLRLERDISQQRDEHERDMDRLEVERKDFVTHQHLDAVVEPMKRVLDTLTRDVKEILRVVSSHRSQD